MKHFFLREKRLQVFDGVYEPREDSYLLAEAVKIVPYAVCLDLGCGTGIQGINMLLQGAKKCVFSDINHIALDNAKENVRETGFEEKAEFVESSLFEKISGKFDCIAFNAPYVVSEKIEHADTDGGEHGRKILDAFLKQFPKHLNKTGHCFFLQSSLNGIGETEEMLNSNDFEYKIVARQKLFFEEILVFKAWKS